MQKNKACQGFENYLLFSNCKTPGKERIKKKLKRNPNPELYKQSADKADEVIRDLDIEFMPPENKKPSRNKEQQRARESQKSRAKQTKRPEMVI